MREFLEPERPSAVCASQQEQQCKADRYHGYSLLICFNVFIISWALVLKWSCSSLGMASDNNHSYPGRNMAEILKNIQLIQSVVTAHRPWLKTILGNTSGPKYDLKKSNISFYERNSATCISHAVIDYNTIFIIYIYMSKCQMIIPCKALYWVTTPSTRGTSQS